MSLIAIDARESGTTTGRYIDKLIEYLHRLKPAHEFVILTRPDRIGYIKSIAPEFRTVETNIKEFTFAEQLGLKKQILELKPDLVYFPMIQQPILYRKRVVTNIQDFSTLRFVNPIKNPLVFGIKRIVYARVIKIVAKKSVSLITISKFVKQDIVNYTHVDPSKITVTYEAADFIKDKPEQVKSLSGKDFIFYIGRPLPHKNLERLVDAFSLLSKEKPDLVLALVGKTDLNFQRIENIVKKKGVKNVVFTGFVSEGQLKWMYQNCRAYVFPSLSEGFGLPALEAMAHGAPVVSSNGTCLPEIYGEAAKYFDPLNIDDMAKAINEVISDKDLRNSLIQMGHMQVKKYSWKKMAEQTLKVFDKALG